MRLSQFLLRRLLAGLGVLWGAATLAFIAMHTTGGDTALAILGGPDAVATQAVIERVRKEYGLDEPVITRYGHYLEKLAHGDLGESYRLRIPVSRAIGQQAGPTIRLASSAAVVAVLISIAVALLTARGPKSVVAAASGAELVFSSIPPFVLGIGLLMLFSLWLPIFPPAGDGNWRSIVLPTLTLALPAAAMLTQVLRQELETILEQPFILRARAQGLSEARVRVGRALRHALIPMATLSGYIFAFLLSGAVVTETLFSRPGLGRLMGEALTSKDIPLVLGITLLSAALYVVINIVVDVFTALIHPRLRETAR